jgi:hypothetical protein
MHLQNQIMEWIIKGELKVGYLLYYEETFNEKMDACKKTKVNASIFFLRTCFCLRIFRSHFYKLCSSNLYIYKFSSYMQDVQKLLQMMSFKGMIKDVNGHKYLMSDGLLNLGNKFYHALRNSWI